MVNSNDLAGKGSGLTQIKVRKLWQKTFWILSLLAFSILNQPVVAKETKVDTANHIFCLSTSGNGYNWAAILTWAAETLKDAISQAPDDARFNVACVSGSSSGSVFVASYGSLLQNKQLFKRPDFNPQSITKQEAQILYNSLLYMALAADFSPEVVGFYTIRDGDYQPNLPWWKAQFTLERIMLDFGTRVMLAQHISLADVNQVEKLKQFVRYHTLKELAVAAKDRKIRQQYRQVTFEIWEQSQAILERLYQDAKYQRNDREKDRDDFRDNPQHPVRQALAQKPADGFMALVYGELAFTEYTSAYQKMQLQPPPVENLVPFVFTNEATAKTIIQSPFYQAQVSQQDTYVGQYVICVVPDYYTMIRHGVREPDLMPPAIYRLSPVLEDATKDLGAGVSHFYQPEAEKIWHSQPQFKLMPSTRPWLKDNKLLNARMGIAGGWIESYVSGQATLYLGSGYGLAKSHSNLYFSTFSESDRVEDFARSVIKNYFAPENPEAAIAKIEQHRDHLPVLIQRYQQYDGNHQISWQPIFVDYTVRFFLENKNVLESFIGVVSSVLKLGFNYLPAATTQQSNYLLARTMNVVRKTLGKNRDWGYIYDRSYEDKYYH